MSKLKAFLVDKTFFSSFHFFKNNSFMNRKKATKIDFLISRRFINRKFINYDSHSSLAVFIPDVISPLSTRNIYCLVVYYHHLNLILNATKPHYFNVVIKVSKIHYKCLDQPKLLSVTLTVLLSTHFRYKRIVQAAQ